MPLVGFAGLGAGTSAGTAGTVLATTGAAASTTSLASIATSAGLATVVLGSAMIVSDYLDDDISDEEIQQVLNNAGEKSKTAATDYRYSCTANCIWCQVNIQAQGTELFGHTRPPIQGVGPYFVQGRGVTVQEGLILLSGTHAWVKSIATKEVFKQIDKKLKIYQKTQQYIRKRPPRGLGQGEYRVFNNTKYAKQNSMYRYDIMVYTSPNPPSYVYVNAFTR